MAINTRFFISEVDVSTGGEDNLRCGRQHGYPNQRLAIAAAEKLYARHRDRTYCVALYSVEGEDRVYEKTICYVGASTESDV